MGLRKTALRIRGPDLLVFWGRLSAFADNIRWRRDREAESDSMDGDDGVVVLIARYRSAPTRAWFFLKDDEITLGNIVAADDATLDAAGYTEFKKTLIREVIEPQVDRLRLTIESGIDE